MIGVDSPILEVLHSLAYKWQWLGLITIFLGQYLPYLLVIVFLFLVLSASQGNRLYSFALAALSVILSRGIVTEIIYQFFYRARPFVALSLTPLIYEPSTQASFPSGHMAFLLPISLVVWQQFGSKKGAWFVFLTVLVGIGRVAAGVHWPSDIIGGLIVGAVSFVAVKKIFPKSKSIADRVS